VANREYLVVSPNKVPPSRYEISVNGVAREDLVQHLNGAVPEYKARINKNNYIEIEVAYDIRTLWDVLESVGWELLPTDGLSHLFKRRRDG